MIRKNLLERIIDFVTDKIRKKRILEIAMEYAQNLDGDVVVYNDTVYYVHIMDNYVKRIGEI